MNQRRNGLSNVNGKSESVKEKERMIWSEVGMLVGTLSLLDIIVRGLVLNCPFRECRKLGGFLHYNCLLLHQGGSVGECSCRE